MGLVQKRVLDLGWGEFEEKRGLGVMSGESERGERMVSITNRSNGLQNL